MEIDGTSTIQFSVVIPTYNRAQVVTRAIESALSQGRTDLEVVVVDDASPDETEHVVTGRYPDVRYLRQPTNLGPGPARNRGIQKALGQWIIMLDDDDALLPGAVGVLEDSIAELPELARYPVLEFATSTGQCPVPFKVVNIADYFSGRWVGDMFMILQRAVFLENGLEMPPERGSAGTLWARVAHKFGIPAWDRQLVQLYHDTAERMGTPESFLAISPQMASHHEHFIEWMRCTGLATEHPAYFTDRLLGAATYALLAGQRRRCWNHLRSGAGVAPFSLRLLAVTSVSVLPSPIVRRLFLWYRRRV